ncbi:hypothetical protein EJ08DRAFT_648578 [Tothia fuscella]|uniref:Uncharacterized protein n=1 Tax=Tothia fuscella TaxID=1048955 RepID=A0A9P4TZR5_9PEZI|nr:hypothetical protein EJ08DRAFT_648578 [Tothia fuscella]
MENTTTHRVRKTFKYPTEGDSDSSPPDLDEEEQEQLINEYIENDARKTQGYKRAFLSIPLLLPILYIPSLLSPTSPTSTSTPPTLLLPAILSLLITAYTLSLIPTRFELHPPQPQQQQNQSQQSQSQATNTSLSLSPLSLLFHKYIDHLNAILCILLLPFAYQGKVKGREDDVWFACLPGVVFVLIYIVRTQLKPVDLGELRRLRYGYKGA